MFGPFESRDQAERSLRRRGWIKDVNSEGRGEWYCVCGRYQAINAFVREIKVRSKRGIPKYFYGSSW